jgi:hypothetical protein
MPIAFIVAKTAERASVELRSFAPRNSSGREPGPRFGELVQFDGSPRAWFENRGPRCCLITMTGDTVKIRLSQFFE